MDNIFKESLRKVAPVRLKEPLAETLGALDGEGTIEYGFTDVVKMAGHACPTVSAAYLSCQLALKKLYGEEIPVRGDIAVTVCGEPDDGVYGVMAQVFGYLTGAAVETGFKGLGPRFKRKDLLKFEAKEIDPEAMCFEFRRQDTGKAVLVRFYPRRIPFPEARARRLGELMQPVVWEAATAEEKKEFQELWMSKVEDMLLQRKEIEHWLKLEEVNK